MLNRIHFIIGFGNQNEELSLSAFIKSFKLHSQKQIIIAATNATPLATKVKHQLYNFNYHKLWQKSFYDHVIQDENDFNRIREYIVNNPARWQLDGENPNIYKTRYI
jgi:REP element-mobilizing transposase RayT